MTPVVRLNGVRWETAPPGETPREILRGVDLEIAAGEKLAIIGPSGAGKTTLASVIAGLLDPTAGAVTAAPGSVGLVFQEAERAFFEENVLDDVAFAPRNNGTPLAEAREQARRALLRVGIDPDEFGRRAPETLSGGEARRVAIAGVLAFRPRVVIFDEPTIGLDADGVRRLREIYASLASDGIAVVLVSHDLSLVREDCDRVLLLQEGRVAWDGAADDLFRACPETWRREDVLGRVKRALVGAGWADADTPCTVEALVARLMSAGAG